MAFHEAHFGHTSTVSFGTTFLNPVDGQEYVDAENHETWDEDNLGYYEDGVKRTLTDEQIEIFRHSEFETLRKDQEKLSNGKPSSELNGSRSLDDASISQSEASNIPQAFRSAKKKKKSGKRTKPEPKPDLRKRTWDVVDKGLDTLDYD